MDVSMNDERMDVQVKLKYEASVDKSRNSVPPVIWYEQFNEESFISEA
jgi:hypothetical protein